MKKIIFVLAVTFSFAVLFTACKETKKEEVKEAVQIENHDDHNHATEAMASKDVYQCPMDCEKGKTYVEKGACPVCKMDLKAKSMDSEHADGCKCKVAGECKCESGKCECKADVASSMKECAKCEPGKCQCKAEVVSSSKECTKCEPGKCKCKA